MGYYTSPAMTLSSGENHNKFHVVMNSNSAVILSAWVVPLWLSGQKTRLILKAKNIKVKVMGITFSGLTMRKELTCRGVQAQHFITLPNGVCYPNEPEHEPFETQSYQAICE